MIDSKCNLPGFSLIMVPAEHEGLVAVVDAYIISKPLGETTRRLDIRIQHLNGRMNLEVARKQILFDHTYRGHEYIIMAEYRAFWDEDKIMITPGELLPQS
jgi:hypothetical protein